MVHKIIPRPGFLIVYLRDFILYACYVSPNISLEDYNKWLEDLMASVEREQNEVVIAGDFNAKAAEWGSPWTDNRGFHTIQRISGMDIIVHNTGDKPTFQRGRSESYIDVTMSTPGIAKKIKGWKVSEDETLCTHKYILFECGEKIGQSNTFKKICHINRQAYKEFISAACVNQLGQPSSTDCDALLSSAFKNSRTTIRERLLQPYWWNESIATQRNNCSRSRRTFTRLNKTKPGTEEAENARKSYKSERKQLNKEIERSKKKCWQDLCKELDEDIWGKGYQIVSKKMGQQKTASLTPERERDIVNALFPTRSDYWLPTEPTRNVDEISMEELHMAKDKIRCNRAPGPDGIPPEAIKYLVEDAPDYIRSVMNGLLCAQSFPNAWKLAKVILIPKPGRNTELPSDFRPLCLTNAVAKLYEIIIKTRLEVEIDKRGGLNENQFGFRKGRSTIDAIAKVQSLAKKAKNERKWCAMVTVDVKNAFNSASWAKIIGELRKRGIPPYLMRIVEQYLCQRELKTKNIRTKMTAGIPQGSVLGPLLWNVFYDSILELGNGNDTTIIAYADDIAVVAEGEDEASLVANMNHTLWEVNKWMTKMELQIATEKTEAVILCEWGRKQIDTVFTLRRTPIRPSTNIKYLGVLIDRGGTHKTHIVKTAAKALQQGMTFTRIMNNTIGPRYEKRVLLNGVVQSTILYGAPIWHEALSVSKYKILLQKAQRCMLLRVVSAYKTASNSAIQVISGIPPIHLQVLERVRLYNSKTGHLNETKRKERECTIQQWQEEWEQNVENAQWTRRLIPDIRKWTGCNHKKTEYFLTQFLTGHGSFRTYTARIGKHGGNECIYCGITDTPEHTIFHCDRWETARMATFSNMRNYVTPDNIVDQMIADKKDFEKIHSLIIEIMKQKENEEREYQMGENNL